MARAYSTPTVDARHDFVRQDVMRKLAAEHNMILQRR